MSIVIRPAVLADEDVIVQFNAALARESEGLTLHEPTLRLGVRSCLADPHRGFYTLAELDGVPAGQILITRDWSDWRNGWFWWIHSVYVREEARRVGVFRALFEHLKERAIADSEVIGLRLCVEFLNDRAKATYASIGMTEEHYHLLKLYPLPGRTSAF